MSLETNSERAARSRAEDAELAACKKIELLSRLKPRAEAKRARKARLRQGHSNKGGWVEQKEASQVSVSGSAENCEH